MWNDLYRNRFLQYTNKEDFIDNICPENKIQRKGETIVCESHNQINDWIFLRIPIQGQTTYSFEFKAIIHSVNTEFQLSFAAATRKYIEAGKDLEGKGFDPRKLLAPGAEAIKATVKEKMELFGSVGKAE